MGRQSQAQPGAFRKSVSRCPGACKGKTLFAQDLYGGANETYRIKTRVYTELAWHSLFIRTLLIRPERAELESFKPELTIIDLPSFKPDAKRHGGRDGSDTMVAIDFSRKIVIICGSSYAGEMKKSVFTTLNFYLPAQGVMPMHCSANVGPDGDSALFFGLSGTGKTTLSADPNRTLIGDDETGWGPDGIFNFEGGCYAKTIKLSREAEPQIWDATNRFGAILENVAFDPITRVPDYDDQSKTENTRSAYPLDFIPNASRTGCAGHPKNVIFLTADAFGVMPPIAKLTPAQAMYHFLSGYTAKVAGTEKGLVGVQPEFSTCFGAPFLPRPPAEYGGLFRKYITEHEVDCWLVNSGWSGGIYGVGRRMPIKATRALVTAALNGSLKEASFRTDPYFGFSVPTSVPGVEPHLLYPMKTWKDKADSTPPRASSWRCSRATVKFQEEWSRRARRGAGSSPRGGITIGHQNWKGRVPPITIHRGRPFVCTRVKRRQRKRYCTAACWPSVLKRAFCSFESDA